MQTRDKGLIGQDVRPCFARWCALITWLRVMDSVEVSMVQGSRVMDDGDLGKLEVSGVALGLNEDAAVVLEVLGGGRRQTAE